jgi:hypothetical protein
MDTKPPHHDDVERVMQEVQQANQKAREFLEKNRDPYKTSVEVMKSAHQHGQRDVVKIEEQSAIKESQENLSEAEPDALGDRPHHHFTAENKAQSSAAERLTQWIGRAREKMQELQTKYPNTYAAGRSVATVVRGRTLLGRAAAEAAHLHETYEKVTGQEFEGIKHFIEQAKLTKGTEEQKAKGQPYAQRAAADRSQQVRWLERQQAFVERGYQREYSMIVDSWSTEEKPGVWAAIRRASGDRDEISSRIKELKVETLEEVVAKRGGNHPEIAHKLAQSKPIAEEYQKSLMQGTASEKYNYFLDKVHTEIGHDYFNLHLHPQRAINFDRAAANQLYADGFSKEQVAKTIQEGAFYRSLFMKEVEYDGKKTEIISYQLESSAREYMQRSSLYFSEVTQQQREKTLDWQANKGQPVQQRRLNQEEFPTYQALKAQANQYAHDRKMATELEALETLQGYWQDGKHLNDQTTRTQFLLEHGRMVIHEGRASSYQLAYRLHAAGHEQQEIVATLKELAPEVNNSSKLSHDVYHKMLEVTQRSPERTAEMETIQAFKREHNLENERRLDRLPMARGVSQEPSVKGKTYTDEPKTGTVSRSHSMEEYEPER